MVKHLTPYIFFLVVLVTLQTCQTNDGGSLRPKAHQGSINLKEWNFKEQGPVKLDGEWVIYPGKFVEPSNSWNIWTSNKEQQSYYKVPEIWNPIVGEGAPDLTATGFATYILEVKGGLLEDGLPFAIQLKSARSAYALFIIPRSKAQNEQAPTMVNGQPGVGPDTEIPQNLMQTKSILPPAEDFLVMVHVSNHVIMLGGLRNPIWIGPESVLRATERHHERMAFLVAGVVALLSIYHLILYAGRRENNIHLLFASICSLILVWYLLFDRLIHKSLPEPSTISFKMIDMAITWAYSICLPLFCDFLRRLFPKEFPKKIVQATWVVTIVNLLIRTIDYSGTYLVFVSYNLFMSIVVGASIIFLFRAFRNRCPGAGESLMGFVFFAGAIFIDVAKTHNLIQTPTLAPIGLILFSIIHSFILTRRRDYAGSPIAQRSPGNYRRSYLRGSDTDSLLDHLNELMDIDKLYRDQELNVKGLATELKVSTHQLSELLNTKLGTTFKGYVRTLRVAEAKEHLALANADVAIEAIAYSVGFGSVSNFHRLFKKETGLTPKEYQKKHSSS